MKKILLCGLLILIITLNAGCSAELYLDDTIKRFNTDKITNSPLSDVQYDGPPPSVIFTFLPPVGSGAYVQGMTYNAVGKYKISLWIKCSWGGQLRVGGWGWWPKSYFDAPYAGISADGSWSDDYVVAGVDSGASTMVAFLVPINQEVYPNYSILNHAYANSVAYALSNRHNDVNTPTISITDPTSNVVTYNKYYTISGTYWDDRELYGLFVSLNSSAYYLAPNTLQLTYSTHSWSHTLTLKEGVNTFKVYTKDGTEKYSTIETGPTITYINAPISIENVRDNGIINTGVITGKATNYGDVSAVEYKLDNGVYQTAQGIENWSFRLPDGANSWLIGSRHTVSIRIRYLNGNYSTVITINIIKGINKDINGDGYEDLVTGSPGNGSQGLSYIFYGKTSGITSGPVSGADTTILCSDSGSFGSSITVGDINNDGYADLVVGDSSYNNNQGRVFIYYGSASGISSSFASSADLVITGIDYSKFGNSLALANVTGNGYMELLVGASNFENGKGAVYLFFGTSSGITVNKAIYANARLTGDVNSGFGHKIATADVNGDGYADLISSDKNYNNHQGRVCVFHGNPFGINSITPDSANTIVYGTTDSWFGESLAGGDVNKDGYADIVVGAIGFMSGQGSAYIFYGSSGGSATSPATTIIGQTASAFGTSLVLGDLNGNGNLDLAVGANLFNSGQGEVYIFNNNGSGISSGNASSANTILNGEAANGFGLSLSIRDINRDNYPDLIVAEGNSTINQGWVYIFHNGDTGISSGGSSTANTILSGDVGFYFGSAIDF